MAALRSHLPHPFHSRACMPWAHNNSSHPLRAFHTPRPPPPFCPSNALPAPWAGACVPASPGCVLWAGCPNRNLPAVSVLYPTAPRYHTLRQGANLSIALPDWTYTCRWDDTLEGERERERESRRARERDRQREGDRSRVSQTDEGSLRDGAGWKRAERKIDRRTGVQFHTGMKPSWYACVQMIIGNTTRLRGYDLQQ